MSKGIELTEWGRKGKMRYVKESEKKIKKDKKWFRQELESKKSW